jgi:hypothetical protein
VAAGKGNGSGALVKFLISINCICSGLIPLDIASFDVVCCNRCSLVKQVLHLEQLAAMGASRLYLDLLKVDIEKTNTWRSPSQSGKIVPLVIGTLAWTNVV